MLAAAVDPRWKVIWASCSGAMGASLEKRNWGETIDNVAGLGARGLGTSQMPALDVALMDGDLAFRNHEGGHIDAPDWPIFLQFARRDLDRR